MHGLPQLANALAVNHTDLANSFLAASGQVLPNDVLHVVWPERVEIQNALDRQLKWLVHDRNTSPGGFRNRPLAVQTQRPA